MAFAAVSGKDLQLYLKDNYHVLYDHNLPIIYQGMIV